MIRILSEEFIHDNELEILIWLLDSGLDYYHVRKVDVTEDVLIQFLNQIPIRYRDKIVLHHNLSIRGFLIHHKSTQRVAMVDKIHSCSVHHLTEALVYLPYYNHVFWSPVFDSISKLGYSKNTEIDLSSIKNTEKKKLIALGGIQPSKFTIVKTMGFSQIAIKGWFWNQVDYKQAWREIQTKWQELEKMY